MTTGALPTWVHVHNPLPLSTCLPQADRPTAVACPRGDPPGHSMPAALYSPHNRSVEVRGEQAAPSLPRCGRLRPRQLAGQSLNWPNPIRRTGDRCGPAGAVVSPA